MSARHSNLGGDVRVAWVAFFHFHMDNWGHANQAGPRNSYRMHNFWNEKCMCLPFNNARYVMKMLRVFSTYQASVLTRTPPWTRPLCNQPEPWIKTGTALTQIKLWKKNALGLQRYSVHLEIVEDEVQSNQQCLGEIQVFLTFGCNSWKGEVIEHTRQRGHSKPMVF